MDRLVLPLKKILLPLLATALCVALPRLAASQQPSANELVVSERFEQLMTEVVRTVIPHSYVNEKDWGQTKDVVRGLYVKREGLRIKTHRTYKAVNHGTWKRYQIDLLDPQQQFQIQLNRLRILPSGRMAFDIACDARVRIFGRVSQWQRGVQLFSLSAEADASVQLTMQCDLATQIDTSPQLPALTLDPVVRDADLAIKDFRMREISQLDGPGVKLLSATIREVLEDELAKRRVKLVEKINRQIDKRRDDLRLSLSEMLGIAEND